MTRKQKKTLVRILAAAVLLIGAALIPVKGIWRLALFLVPYFWIGYDILSGAVRNILHGQVFDEKFLMALATVGAFCVNEYAEGVFVMLFYQVGELFQSVAVGKSRRSIAALMDIRPDTAEVEREGGTVTVYAGDVAVGDVCVVRPGEKLPLDGVILSGTAALDTSALTGESLPRDVGAGDEVLGGCVDLTGLLRVRVTKPYEESTVSKVLDLVENADANKARSERFITRFARYYTPAVVAAAVLLALVPSLITGDWAAWVHRALIFLVVSCPCALVISVPLTFFGSIGGASRRGILVKGSDYLEALADCETVCFDKTGTLTRGSFEVASVRAVGTSEAELLRLAAAVEAGSNHPIARAIGARAICAAGQSGDQSRTSDVREIPGQGISAVVDGRTVAVGNPRLLASLGVPVPEVYGIENGVGTLVCVAVDGAFAGTIVVADTLKPESHEAHAELSALGVKKTVMLSGDREAVASRVAADLGLTEYRAELLPGDKVTALEEIMSEPDRRGRVAYVGDGINDAPVLARADVGIAMGALGSDAAIEAADVVLMDDDLARLPEALRLARRTRAIVRQNIVLALGVKAAVLLLGALGLASMWAAVFADVGVAVLAILNAMRTLR